MAKKAFDDGRNYSKQFSAIVRLNTTYGACNLSVKLCPFYRRLYIINMIIIVYWQIAAATAFDVDLTVTSQ